MLAKQSRLFCYDLLDAKDELDEKLEKSYHELSAVTANRRENEIYDHLNQKVCKGAQEHEEVILGLLYSLLIDPTAASKNYSTLAMIARDGMAHLIRMVEIIILEKLPKLQDGVKDQLFWLVRELVQTRVIGADILCYALLKQLPAGSISRGDIWLAESLLHLLLDNRSWLESQPALVDSVLFTYLSLIPSHFSAKLSTLREQETGLCISLLRSKFMDRIQIGRDLIRLLQNVARIPEFMDLWKDMLQNPERLSPQFTGALMITSKRTSRRFISGRITPELEIKLNFLLSKVKFGQHKKYQEWFQKKHLSSPESLELIPELIRYICCVIHPTNEILGSDILPRWAVVGWLLSLCQANPVISSLSKLALFYDWLFYSESDNIMNIEPGILLMHHSLRSHHLMTASLLDFLCRLISSYSPALDKTVESGIKMALTDILHKGVVPSLDTLFDSPKLDNDLKAMLKANFSEFYPQGVVYQASCIVEESSFVDQFALGSNIPEETVITISDDDLIGEDDEVTSAFSDVEGNEPEGFQVITEGSNEDDSNSSTGDAWARIHELSTELQEKLLSFREERNSKLLDDCLELLEKTGQNENAYTVVALLLAELLSDDFAAGCIVDHEAVSQTRPNERHCQCLFRHACNSSSILSLLVALHRYLPKVGYFFLFYLQKTRRLQDPFVPYSDFVGMFSEPFVTCVVRDMKECVENEPGIFYMLLPDIYKQFQDKITGVATLLNMVVANIDPVQLCRLVHKLMLKQFQIFGHDCQLLQETIINSLQWDSFEQFCVWQLLSAEDPDIQTIILILEKLSPEEHPEAFSSALLLLKCEPVSVAALGCLFSLPVSTHCGVVDAVGSHWLNLNPSKYAKYLSQLMEKATVKIDILLEHLTRILTYLSSSQIFEVSEHILPKSLIKLFTSFPEFLVKFENLYRMASTYAEDSKKRPQESISRIDLKSKKRKVMNIDDLLDA